MILMPRFTRLCSRFSPFGFPSRGHAAHHGTDIDDCCRRRACCLNVGHHLFQRCARARQRGDRPKRRRGLSFQRGGHSARPGCLRREMANASWLGAMRVNYGRKSGSCFGCGFLQSAWLSGIAKGATVLVHKQGRGISKYYS